MINLEFICCKGDIISPGDTATPHRTTLTIRRRFQFSSALKRMSTICSLPSGKLVFAVKGAPETIKGMLSIVPEAYDETYKYYTRRGSRVLALGFRETENMPMDKVGRVCLTSEKLMETHRHSLGQQASSGSSGDRINLCRIPCLPLSTEARCN